MPPKKPGSPPRNWHAGSRRASRESEVTRERGISWPLSLQATFGGHTCCGADGRKCSEGEEGQLSDAELQELRERIAPPVQAAPVSVAEHYCLMGVKWKYALIHGREVKCDSY